MGRKGLVWAGVVAAGCLAACGTKVTRDGEPAANLLAPPAAAPSAREEVPPGMRAENYDPLESVNRKIFAFNDTVDVWILEPAAKGWDFVVPRRVESSIANFFQNLRFPIVTVNDLLQGKLAAAASDVGRFAVNTTAGVAGFFDPATSLGLEQHDEDFGQTLGWWGVGPGAYLVLPILGPSNLRDTAGIVVDYPLAVTPLFVDWYYTTGARVVEVVNARAMYLEELRNAKSSAFDFYSFVRNAYSQRRAALVTDHAAQSREDENDLYQLYEEPTQ